jgi:hypothetical protein
MHHKTLILLALSAFSLSLLSGCGGPRGVRVTEGDQPIGSAPTGSLFATNQSTIVHVNEFDRLATIRNARQFTAGTFLETRDRQGNKSATLKTRENRATGLGTADIVEGLPQINDRATAVSAAESARLEKIYPDTEAE